MRNYLFVLLTSATFIIGSCKNAQTQNINTNLSATEFAAKVAELPASPLVDVRTPDEFAQGHLPKAINIDWKGGEFQKQITTLDKSKPILVYCLVGGRSAAAAKQMRLDGFKEVYELTGGIQQWRAANLPETKGN